MRRFAAYAMLLAVALGSSPGEGKPRRARSLSNKQCFLICARMGECAGLAHQRSSLAETAICADDCIVESREKERRAGWMCASRAEGCEALKNCHAGGMTEPTK